MFASPNIITSKSRFETEKTRRLQERSRNLPRLANIYTGAPATKALSVQASRPLLVKASIGQIYPLTEVTYQPLDVFRLFPMTTPVYATVAQVDDNSYRQLLAIGTDKIDPKFLPNIEDLQSIDYPLGFARQDDLALAVTNLWSVLGPQIQSLRQQIGAVQTNSHVSNQINQLKSDLSTLEQQAINLQQQTSVDIYQLARLKYPAPAIVSTTVLDASKAQLAINLRTGITNELVDQIFVKLNCMTPVANTSVENSTVNVILPIVYSETELVSRNFEVFERYVDGTVAAQPLSSNFTASTQNLAADQISYKISFTPSGNTQVASFDVLTTLSTTIPVPTSSAPGISFTVNFRPVSYGLIKVSVQALYQSGIMSLEATTITEMPAM